MALGPFLRTKYYKGVNQYGDHTRTLRTDEDIHICLMERRLEDSSGAPMFKSIFVRVIELRENFGRVMRLIKASSSVLLF